MCFHTRAVSKAEQLEIYFGVKRSAKEKEAGNEFIYHHANGYAMIRFGYPQERPDKITPMMWGLLPFKNPGPTMRNIIGNRYAMVPGSTHRRKSIRFRPVQGDALTVGLSFRLAGSMTPIPAKAQEFKVPYYFEQKDSPIISLAGIYSITPDNYVSFSRLQRRHGRVEIRRYPQQGERDGENRQVIPSAKGQSAWLSNDLKEDEVYEIVDNDYPKTK